ncbi:MAG: S-methyl-5-thioribose-1-phosphate isomerase, partial [Firmicutes bacterium]|nr:S-methyl-5-thioribose-1-phosphate isomerase [Bacillota bacterium]
MQRADHDLAFMLQYENVAWYDSGEVRILDRRVYPARTEFVVCRSHREVAQAITDMVTQSAGPFTAAPMGMALAAYECRDLSADAQREFLADAADTIANARPTTAKRMRALCDECLSAADAAIESGVDAARAIVDRTVEMNNERYGLIDRIAHHLVEKIPRGGTVMTFCFAETIVGMMLRECRRTGKEIKLFCPETRPYFQGARL